VSRLGGPTGVRMDLNKAGVHELADVVGLPGAYDLILWRPYLSWEEVACVPGFDDAGRLAQLRRAGFEVKLPENVSVLHPDGEPARPGGTLAHAAGSGAVRQTGGAGMAQDQDKAAGEQQQQQDGGRRGEPNHIGGAAQEGHLNPQIDTKGGKSEKGGQIAQDRQQSSGSGMGQA